MATKRFGINTSPHVAEIGDHLTLEFKPEVMGDEWMDAYLQLREAQQGLPSDPEQVGEVDPGEIRKAAQALREFLAGFMLPDSAERFADTPLPDRVLVELFQWLTELYGGRPTGSSSASGPPSQPMGSGTRSTATSRSRASTSTRGRSAASATRSKR